MMGEIAALEEGETPDLDENITLASTQIRTRLPTVPFKRFSRSFRVTKKGRLASDKVSKVRSSYSLIPREIQTISLSCILGGCHGCNPADRARNASYF